MVVLWCASPDWLHRRRRLALSLDGRVSSAVRYWGIPHAPSIERARAAVLAKLLAEPNRAHLTQVLWAIQLVSFWFYNYNIAYGLIMDITGYHIHFWPSSNSPIEKRYHGYPGAAGARTRIGRAPEVTILGRATRAGSTKYSSRLNDDTSRNPSCLSFFWGRRRPIFF